MKTFFFGVSTLVLAACAGESKEEPSGENKANEKPSQFQWNFDQQKKFVYSFSQVINAENYLVKGATPDKSYLIGKGELFLDVNESNLASLRISEMEMKQVNYDENGNAGDTVRQSVPEKTASMMKSDGSFLEPNPEILFDLLFPLPSKFLENGDSDQIPLVMSFANSQSRIISRGFNTLTYLGVEELNGKKCHALKGEIDVSKLEIPQGGAQGAYDFSIMGEAKYYVDLENQRYLGADIDMVFKVFMDTKKDNPSGMFLHMESSNKFSIRLVE